ncbi:UDP-N-acetylmuramoyl-tripeptide--D-alanyl-D-alanine ligase [Patescibacteria group bacterium]|nr:UDP-N-acetylmuramoyl-tripeptide--D-alanyl-D-alanine ligase [Patescibacteria group bacterium]
MKKIVQKILYVLAHAVLKKYKPEVIGITGSMGKTSTKEAIFAVLSSKFRVRQNLKNYNNELGLPLSILGVESGQKSLVKWFGVFFHGLKLWFGRDPNYPQILVLEMGADHPGDIKYLTELAPCKIGVVTGIGPAHLEFFESVEKIIKEKRIVISHLKQDGFAVLNRDDEKVYEMREKTRAKVLTYGFNQEAEVRAQEEGTIGEGMEIKGMNFKLSYAGSVVPIFLPGVLGRQHIYAALAGAAIGIIHGMNLVEVAESLKRYAAPKGRMNLIPGIKRTLIIDDTYNASPIPTEVALDVLRSIKLPAEDDKKFAVLGDMLELGSFSEEGHKQVGRAAAASRVDYLVTVGERARDISRAALEAGMAEDRVSNFSTPEEAGLFVQGKMKQGDVVLVKGSQGMRMEKVVKELMAEPLQACELLVRQDSSWACKRE